MSKEQSKPIIVQTPDTCGGRPWIDGTRISVEHVVASYRAFLEWLFIKDFIEQYPHVKEHEVLAALEYYRDHREEIDQSLALGREVEREHGQILR